MRLGRQQRGRRWSSTLAVALLASVGPSVAQTQTVGVFRNDDRSSEGYTLIGTKSNRPPSITYLIDNGGLVVNAWGSG